MKRTLVLIMVLSLLSGGCAKLKELNRKETFIQAVKNGNLSVVRVLLDEGIKPDTMDQNGVPALMWASEEGHIEIVKILLDKGVDVNIKRKKDGTTSLMETAEEGHTDVVRLLLDRGAKVNVKRKSDGLTALMEASDKCHTKIVKLLLDKGAEVDTQSTKNGTTALMEASDEGCTDIVKLLLSKGADVNVQRTKDGTTALMEAAEGGRNEIVRLLLDNGADVNKRAIINNVPFTALKLAEKERHRDIVNMLEKATVKEIAETTTAQYDQIALSNIKDLTDAQETYYMLESTFCDSLEELKDEIESDGLDLKMSPDVTITIEQADDDGYVMKVLHDKGQKIYMSRFCFSEKIDDGGNPEISEIEDGKVTLLKGIMKQYYKKSRGVNVS